MECKATAGVKNTFKPGPTDPAFYCRLAAAGMPTVDTFLGPIYNAAFVSPYAAPCLWLAFAVVVAPWAKLILFVACALLAAGPVVLQLYRAATARPIKDWTEEVVVVTGGSHGLGKLLCETLLRRHNPRKIVVLDLMRPDIADDRICFYECDVADRDQVAQVAARVRHEVGHVTVLVNNAGVVTSSKLLVDADEASIERAINVNLLGQIWVAKAFLPDMLAQNKGHIVTVASVVGHIGSAHASSYCASKAGVIGFHESLRQEVHGTNVRATALYPGLISTGMFTGVSHARPWLTPILQPATAVDRLIDALAAGVSRDLWLPLYANAAPALRLLPLEFADWARQLTGSNKDMASFEYSLSSRR
ncbi:hypothetical protein HDU89_008125 [Geranomyces variabilis]|nr:hypothetical protein HDU89_008125 [Geranomyces variabilis]